MKRTSVAAFVAIVALAFIGTVNATNGVSRETTAAAGIVQRPVASESLLERRGGRECGGCVATFEELQAMLSMPGMLGTGSTTTINLCKSTKETALVLMNDLIITGTDITVHFKCCGSQEAMMARPFKAKKAERQGRCQITRVMKPSGEPTKIMFATTASGEMEGFMAHPPKIIFSSIWFAESMMAWEWPLGGPVLQSRGVEMVFYFNWYGR